ncbi:biotin--[acetyl-CoA-carboxylase] ligase [Methyloversatilis thermotolerans]|uniref:biotin--[acetyl-CoA-carboxylase] ligase n=1 Tax=Methyloversatilis thermotolerans TaxID=1346290 RepID=UPI0003681EF2|nr:biotin--[acetyl-CoA-carboxylase] ligase [Methyloversatilis thermotolerans]
MTDPEQLTRALCARLRTVSDGWHIDVCQRTGSTNSDLLALRGDDRRVLCALEQTAGRGRRGRDWTSAAGDSLTFSLRIRFSGRADRLAGLSLAVGVVLAEALQQRGVDGLALKWPNDLMRVRDGVPGKLGGVLIELLPASTHVDVVIGVGLNLAPPPPGDYAHPPVALFAGPPAEDDWLATAGDLIAALIEALPRFADSGFAGFATRWEGFNLHAGRQVLVLGEQTTSEGRCVGVDVDGALRLERDGVVSRVLSGDVTLRAANPA